MANWIQNCQICNDGLCIRMEELKKEGFSERQSAANRKDNMKIYIMTLEEIETRRRFLRNQARDLIRVENDLKIKIALTKIHDIYKGRISKKFDPVLSQKLDCLTWLLEN